MNVSGIDIGYDSSVPLVIPGQTGADAPEEKFTCTKRHASRPMRAAGCYLKSQNMVVVNGNAVAVPTRG